MPIKFQCTNPDCCKTLSAKEELCGRRIKCPNCGTVQVVPSSQTDIVHRFFGREEAPAPEKPRLVANPAIENPLSLQVLFSKQLALDPQQLTQALRAYHPSMKGAIFEIDPQLAAQGTPLGLAGWGRHVVKLVGFDMPMPKPVVEACVQPAHYPQDVKEQARAHQAHAILYYAGYEEDPREQYLALLLVAGTLASFGALVVTNEDAHTSFPAHVLVASEIKGDRLEVLRSLPLLILFCGFVKFEIEGVRGVWMRTFGAHLLGAPDLAYRAKGHHQGEMIFDMFNNILEYLLESGAKVDAGHTMQVGDDLFLRLRLPKKKEAFLDSPGELYVAELITADEINRG